MLSLYPLLLHGKNHGDSKISAAQRSAFACAFMGEGSFVEAEENPVMEIFYRLLYCAGLPRLAAWWNRKRVLILGYHGVTRGTVVDPSQIHVRECLFREQIRHLKQAYNVISLGQFIERRRKNLPLPPYSVILTFDDGFRNFLSVTAPILFANSIPATVFIITAYVRHGLSSESPIEWTSRDDCTLLSWDEVRRLNEQGIEFGAHTCTHPQLDTLSPDQVAREMLESFNAISGNLANTDVAFAYPYGICTEDLQKQSMAAGFSCALTCKAGFVADDSDLHALDRILIGNESFYMFAIHLSGLHRLLTRIPSFIGNTLRKLCGIGKGRSSTAPCSFGLWDLSDPDPALGAKREDSDPGVSVKGK
jgi:peptidoglycan/xylan/chitin deacetylase (PgdA/CDA1 family)